MIVPEDWKQGSAEKIRAHPWRTLGDSEEIADRRIQIAGCGALHDAPTCGTVVLIPSCLVCIRHATSLMCRRLSSRANWQHKSTCRRRPRHPSGRICKSRFDGNFPGQKEKEDVSSKTYLRRHGLVHRSPPDIIF